MKSTSIAAVVNVLNERGAVTLDDLQKALPELTRMQLQNSLDYARARRLVKLLKKGSKRDSRNPSPSVWGPYTAPPEHVEAITSVWQLGSGPVQLPTASSGRMYEPLGSWGE